MAMAKRGLLSPGDANRKRSPKAQNEKTLQTLQGFKFKWCRRAESNRRHEDFQI